jgi:mannose-1-phosphate guanylyltransferase/mannose-1-phosphate guanylyltransferase/phosphomannomutase
MITQAFVLGAGLGTRLRPLTEDLPKPLVPIFQKPLITFAFDHLIDAGVEKFCVNTHHQPQCFDQLFPGKRYRDKPVTFRHEPVLLETGGGIANVADLLGAEPFLVYNADILSDLPLRPLIAEHERAENMVTLALRSGGGPQHISLNGASGEVTDIRNMLATGAPEEFVFTGIYAVQPEFLKLLEHGVKRSVITTFLEMIRRGEKLGGVVIDDGHWWDVGTRAAYMQLHRDLPQLEFPRYGAPDQAWRDAIHASAVVGAGTALHGCSVVGAGAQVHADSILNDTIVWAGAQIASRSQLSNCIVRRDRTAEGILRDTDI